jgi:hypothetical protein
MPLPCPLFFERVGVFARSLHASFTRDETCPVSTEGWTRRVHFVREGVHCTPSLAILLSRPSAQSGPLGPPRHTRASRAAPLRGNAARDRARHKRPHPRRGYARGRGHPTKLSPSASSPAPRSDAPRAPAPSDPAGDPSPGAARGSSPEAARDTSLQEASEPRKRNPPPSESSSSPAPAPPPAPAPRRARASAIHPPTLSRSCARPACGKGTRRVQLVRRDGRDVSTLYEREGGGGRCGPRLARALHPRRRRPALPCCRRPRAQRRCVVPRRGAQCLRLRAAPLRRQRPPLGQRSAARRSAGASG